MTATTIVAIVASEAQFRMDHRQFSDLALAEATHLYRLAVFLSSAQEAEDLVQETYVRAFRSRATYQPDHQSGHQPGGPVMRRWLFRILHNVLYSKRSAEQRQREAIEQLSVEPMPAPSASSVPTASGAADGHAAAIDWDQVDERLRDAIGRLPLHHRTVFLLCAVEGLRYREVAAITQVPLGTVMSRLCRARATLVANLSTLAAERRLTRASRDPASEHPPERKSTRREVADGSTAGTSEEGRSARP